MVHEAYILSYLPPEGSPPPPPPPLRTPRDTVSYVILGDVNICQYNQRIQCISYKLDVGYIENNSVVF